MKSWSVSSIRGFHTCQLQWFFRRQGIPEETRPLPLVLGIVVHSALEFTLRGMQAGAVPPEEEVIDLLDAVLFDEEMKGEVRYGKKSREETLELLEAVYRHWRENFRLEGEILSVEQEVRAQLPGLDLPLLGYADLVLKTDRGLVVVDFKTTASKPYTDDLFDPLDLQRLAMTRGLETATGEPVVGWTLQHLVKTKSPQLIVDAQEVHPEARDAELARLRAIVNPTIRAMRDVEEGRAVPVPNQSWFAPCTSCGYREACSRWPGKSAPAAHATAAGA